MIMQKGFSENEMNKIKKLNKSEPSAAEVFHVILLFVIRHPPNDSKSKS